METETEVNRVEVEVPDGVTPVSLYEAVGGNLVLENQGRGWKENLVGAEPVERFRYVRDDEDARTGFDLLSDWFEDLRSEFDVGGSVDAGVFGYVGYDVAKETEDVPDETTRDFDLPDVAFDFYDTVLKLRGSKVVVESVGNDGDAEERAERMGREVDEHDFDAEGSEGQPSVEVESVESNFDRQTYEEAVERVQERIREGETFQANISQRLGFDTDADPVEVYSALRRTNPAPYMGLFELDSGSVVSTSPELLLRKTGDELRTRPIAGTRPRGDDESEDEELRDDLKASEKERAEHSILVDLERNDLGKVSEYGTVTVERFMETVRYPEVQHLESVVTGNARDGTGAFDALAAMFPGGTVTGAPKPRTLSIIEEVEPTERGPYTGSLGHVSLTGDATFNILIRTVVTDGSRSYLQVGGGVVHDSDPSEEYAETLDKAKGVLNALESRDEDQEVGIGTW